MRGVIWKFGFSELLQKSRWKSGNYGERTRTILQEADSRTSRSISYFSCFSIFSVYGGSEKVQKWNSLETSRKTSRVQRGSVLAQQIQFWTNWYAGLIGTFSAIFEKKIETLEFYSGWAKKASRLSDWCSQKWLHVQVDLLNQETFFESSKISNFSEFWAKELGCSQNWFLCGYRNILGRKVSERISGIIFIWLWANFERNFFNRVLNCILLVQRNFLAKKKRSEK